MPIRFTNAVNLMTLPGLEEQSLALQCLRNSEFALEDLVLLFDGRVNAALTPEERAYAEEVQTQLHMALQKTSEGTNLLGSIPDPIEQQVGDAGEQNTEELLDQETERLLFRHLLSAKGVLGDLEDLHTQKIESAGTLEERADAENILIELRKPLFKLEEAWYWLGGEDMG